MLPVRRYCKPYTKSLSLLLFACVLLVGQSVFADNRTIAIKKKAPSINEPRVALVIGNSQYKNSPLKNPANDAHDIAAVLKGAGFDVITRINADRIEMRNALRLFGDNLKHSSIGLFFYAGHGFQVNGENYLVPIDADVSYEDEVQDECIKVSSVLRKMETAKNRTNLIFLDACRNNPFVAKYRSANNGLAEMDAPIGSLLVYSTAPGAVAADGDGRNGLFTSKLLQYLPMENASINQVLMKVRVDVMQASQKRQVPWESSSLTNDFYFFPSGSNPAQVNYLPSKTAPSNQNALSAEDYLSRAKNSSSTTDKIENLKRALDHDPGLYEAHILIAQTYAKKKQYDLALSYFEKSLEISEETNIHYEVGRIHRILGNDQKAIEHLRFAAKANNYIGKQAHRMLSILQ